MKRVKARRRRPRNGLALMRGAEAGDCRTRGAAAVGTVKAWRPTGPALASGVPEYGHQPAAGLTPGACAAAKQPP
jgi:hypothetical protein